MPFVIAVLALILVAIANSAAAQAETFSCKSYPSSIKASTKTRVEALRLIEREAADRLRGLDTRTFPFLAGKAREASDFIADARVLKAEESLERCQEPLPQLRRICRDAALGLARAIDEEESGSHSKDARKVYADAISRCEALLGLAPLSTPWRAFD